MNVLEAKDLSFAYGNTPVFGCSQLYYVRGRLCRPRWR